MFRKIRKLYRDWLAVGLLAMVVTVPLGLLGWLVAFTDTFNVNAITVVGADEDNVRAIQAAVRDDLHKSAAPEMIFFIPTEVIERSILSEFPDIRSVLVSRKLPGTVKISVIQKEPVWLLLSGGSYYLIDEEGIAYKRAELASLPGLVLPVIRNQDQGVEVRIGGPVVTAEFVDFILDLDAQISSVTKSNVAEVQIPSLAARELTVRLADNWELRLDATRPVDQQMLILGRILTEVIGEKLRLDLEYVDLRIEDRVYYRLTGAVVNEEVSESE